MPRFEMLALVALLGVVIGAWMRRTHPGRSKFVFIAVAILIVLGLVLYTRRTP
jgi:uncharacterized membrane protein YfcA